MNRLRRYDDNSAAGLQPAQSVQPFRQQASTYMDLVEMAVRANMSDTAYEKALTLRETEAEVDPNKPQQ